MFLAPGSGEFQAEAQPPSPIPSITRSQAPALGATLNRAIALPFLKMSTQKPSRGKWALLNKLRQIRAKKTGSPRGLLVRPDSPPTLQRKAQLVGPGRNDGAATAKAH